MADKEALLAAIAAAGTKGKADYEAAQAQLAAQQDAALRSALAGSLVANAPAGMREELSQTISAPYQQRAATLTQNEAGSQDYFNRIGTAAGVYADQVNALGPALQQQYEQELALKMAGSGGGGGSGGSTSDVWDQLRSDFGTIAQAKNYFNAQTASNERGALPGWYAAQQAAQSYGLSPQQVQGLGLDQPDDYYVGASQWLGTPGAQRATPQQAKTVLRVIARGTWGGPIMRARQKALLRKFAPGATAGSAGNQMADVNLVRQQAGW